MIAIGKHLGLQPAMFRRFFFPVREKERMDLGLRFYCHKAHNLKTTHGTNLDNLFQGKIGELVEYIFRFFAVSMRPLDLLKGVNRAFFRLPFYPFPTDVGFDYSNTFLL